MLNLIFSVILAQNFTPPEEPQNSEVEENKVNSSGTRGCPWELPSLTLFIDSMILEVKDNQQNLFPIKVSVVNLDNYHQIFRWESDTSQIMQQIPLPQNLEGEKQAIVVGIPCPSDPYAGQIIETFINR